jgi:hypothetical protein
MRQARNKKFNERNIADEGCIEYQNLDETVSFEKDGQMLSQGV